MIYEHVLARITHMSVPTTCVSYIRFKADKKTFVFPTLKNSGSPGTVCGNLIKVLKVGGSTDPAYIKVALPADVLPEKAHAGGIRPGACNALGTAMPIEWALQFTGHDLRNTSAFFEYFDFKRPFSMPGSIVLSMFEPCPYGTLTMGPRPPTLLSLRRNNVDMPRVDAVIQVLFRLDAATPPFFGPGGRLRPMIESAFAAQVMYFDERNASGERTHMSLYATYVLCLIRV